MVREVMREPQGGAPVTKPDELVEIEEEKDEQVLEREPVEQELMQEGASEAGEHLDAVQADRKRE
jgi:hypothetical protein